MKKSSKVNSKGFGLETFVCMLVLAFIFGYMGSVMGVGPMFKTLLNTAHSVLMDTVLYICAICTVMGAISALFSEFGVINFAQWLLNPVMKPLYNMPGAASLGIVTTFLSDNPAILALAQDKTTRGYFKKYQLPALTNLGTAFGMGMIVCTFMIGLGTEFIPAVGCGLLGTVVGSIFSTRCMHALTKRYYKKNNMWEEMQEYETSDDLTDIQDTDILNKKDTSEKKSSVFSRVMNCILEGGKLGWEICFATTPGVICICTIIMMITFGPGTGANGLPQYTGAAYEGVELLPKLGNLISPILDPLFGFKDGSNIAVPITSLGAVGAAIGLVPKMVENGLAGANEIAVFTAMGMCWSGYLSTHISMMDALDRRELISSALISHTFAGLIAGTIAHYAFVFIG